MVEDLGFLQTEASQLHKSHLSEGFPKMPPSRGRPSMRTTKSFCPPQMTGDRGEHGDESLAWGPGSNVTT